MEFSIRPMTEAERKYSYTQCSQIACQTSCIGHLRQDFGDSGRQFHTAWEDFLSRLNTPEFKAEFKELIDTLRKKGGMLASLSDMQKYGSAHPESAAQGSYCMNYFFRADTDNYSFLFRLNPQRGDYNFYCYAYIRQYLDHHMTEAEKGIRFKDGDYRDLFQLKDGDKVRVFSADGKHRDVTCRYIDPAHLEYGNSIMHIDQLAEILKHNGSRIVPLRSDLPENCYFVHEETGGVMLIVKGHDGCFPFGTSYENRAAAESAVAEFNNKLGVTAAQKSAMIAGCLKGWTSPEADPKNYDKNGEPVKPKHRSSGAR